MYSKTLNFKALRSLGLCAVLTTFFLAPAVFGQNTGGMKGKVRTPSGSGIPNASITVRKDGADVKSVSANSKGDFVIDGLESGRYNVVFEAKGYSGGVLYNVEVKKKKVSDLGDRLILSTDQGTLVIIKGSVFYREGTSLPGAKVELEEVLSDGSTRKLDSSYTNISGEFTFKQREGAGKLRVKATFKGVSGTKVIEVGQAAVYRLAISLDISRTEK